MTNAAPVSSPTPDRSYPPITRFRDEYRFLSNFWFVPGGVGMLDEYQRAVVGPTVEHVFQAMKTLNQAERQEVLDASGPIEAKRLGRHVTLRPRWENVKLAVMAQLQANKYQNAGLAQQLIATGDALLVEGNYWHDTFWGTCSCTHHADSAGIGTGENWLGRILMIQRSHLVLRAVT